MANSLGPVEQAAYRDAAYRHILQAHNVGILVAGVVGRMANEPPILARLEATGMLNSLATFGQWIEKWPTELVDPALSREEQACKARVTVEYRALLMIGALTADEETKRLLVDHGIDWRLGNARAIILFGRVGADGVYGRLLNALEPRARSERPRAEA